MSNVSSNAAAWFTRLEPVVPPETWRRPDDPRLGECVEFWPVGPASRAGLTGAARLAAPTDGPPLRSGRPVLVGYPQDEGVRRNRGRPGAAAAPAAIRHWLYRLTPWDAVRRANLASLDLLDLGDVRITGTLEESQQALGEVIAAILTAGAVPIVLGGGHETAYGHYLGYVGAGRDVALINFDAHLDVRPLLDGQGHSGSPFRQALEHPTRPLRGDRYVCVGPQPFAVSREHQAYVRDQGGIIRWASRSNVHQMLSSLFLRECERLSAGGCSVYVTLDSDVVQQADVPGVSAPNPLGLSGRAVAACALAIGASPAVSSFDLVEINPSFDRDGQSARWAALTIWHFLVGLSQRSR